MLILTPQSGRCLGEGLVQPWSILANHYFGFGGCGKLEFEFPRRTYEPAWGMLPAWLGFARLMEEDEGGW